MSRGSESSIAAENVQKSSFVPLRRCRALCKCLAFSFPEHVGSDDQRHAAAIMRTAPHPPRAGPMTPGGPTDPEPPLPVCSVCLEAMLQGDPVVISEDRPPPPPVHVRCWRVAPLASVAIS